MSKPKFTPGPWEIDTDNIVASSDINEHGYIDPYSYIASMGDKPDPEYIANANLIAAAPDMYEALQHFEKTYGPDRTYAEMLFVMKKIHEALAKADGK